MGSTRMKIEERIDIEALLKSIGPRRCSGLMGPG
jgi:hypothetical protein